MRPWHHLTDKPQLPATGGRSVLALNSYLQSHRRDLSQLSTVPVIKIEQAFGRVHSQEGSHVLVVGEGGTQANQPHVLLSHLDVADGSGYQGLQDGSSVVVQQVYLILRGGDGDGVTVALNWLCSPIFGLVSQQSCLRGPRHAHPKSESLPNQAPETSSSRQRTQRPPSPSSPEPGLCPGLPLLWRYSDSAWPRCCAACSG